LRKFLSILSLIGAAVAFAGCNQAHTAARTSATVIDRGYSGSTGNTGNAYPAIW
jgi:hypothetical protein